MSATHQSPRRRPAIAISRPFTEAVRIIQSFISSSSDAKIVVVILACFAAIWMTFDTITIATLDVNPDVSEDSTWAEHFAFGYKHPPMTAWIFRLWFAILPRQDWAATLLAVGMVTIALAITWQVLRDHLDRDRALLGLLSLMFVPLYTFQASKFNANVVMMPFWAAATLFYLRARRTLGISSAIMTGLLVALTFLGKYWGIYLVVGMAITSIVGAGTRRFWRSPAPYLMAVTAVAAVAPHIYWSLTTHDASTTEFLRSGVMRTDSFSAALARSAAYLAGAAAYVTVPLLLLAGLKPDRGALAEITRPTNQDRQQALLLLTIPLVLPALANLMFPHRLTPLWTIPNWALLPVVLYASPRIQVPALAVARTALCALLFGLAAVLASPLVAYLHLNNSNDQYRQHWRQLAQTVAHLSDRPVHLIWGSAGTAVETAFYLPTIRSLSYDPLSVAGRAEIADEGLAIICLSDDTKCQSTSEALATPASRSTQVSLVRSFLGFAGPAMAYRITVVPAEHQPRE